MLRIAFVANGRIWPAGGRRKRVVANAVREARLYVREAPGRVVLYQAGLAPFRESAFRGHRARTIDRLLW